MTVNEPSPEPKKNSQKAGMVLFGDFKGERHIVAPYTEGRFGNNMKYYGLGKGKVDPGEDAFEAGMRECKEETGIDVEKLLGKDAIEKLRRGETVENIDSGYEGVRIKRVMPNALEYTYLGRAGSPNDFALFAIELEGIDHLYDHLKNPANRSHYIGMPQEVYHPVRTMLASNPDKYPHMQDCLNWLRTMHMPQRPWSQGRGGESLPRINGEGDHWFADLEAQYMEKLGRPGDHIRNVPEWQSFQKTLVGDDYKLITKHAEQIKEILIKLHILSGKDEDILKFDTKDSPLVFYQEGADILTVDNYMKAIMDAGMERGDFNLAFCGNIKDMVAKNAPRVERITNSQLAAVVWAGGAEGIDKVADRYQAKPPATPQDNKWLGGDMYDDSLRTDLHAVLKHMQEHEVPISKILQAQPQGALEPPTLQRQD